MSRIAVLSLVSALLVACTHGTVGVADPYEPDPGVDDPAADPQPEDTLVCEDFVTEPHNACGGHEDFSLSLVDAVDADGDGVWSVGEELVVTLEFRSAAEWMNYPGVLAEADAAVTGLPADGDAYWWYGVFADDGYDVEFRLTLDEAAGDEVALLFTVGALNCVDNEFEGWECPTPTPMWVTIPAD